MRSASTMSSTSPSLFPVRFPSSRALRWFVVAVAIAFAFLAGAGPAMAQSEPTLNDIYTAAKAGRIEEAQKLVTHVLVLHPQSAKAHYVQAELFARQNKLSDARTSLATAEKLAPGLSFARPEAVQALRDQLATGNRSPAATTAPPAHAATLGGVGPAPDSGQSSWMLQVGLAIAVIAGGYFIFRRKAPVAAPTAMDNGPAAYPAGYAPGSMPAQNNGLNGPQTFGAAASPGYAPGYQQPYSPAYPQQQPQQPQSPGFGRQIAGGVATGLAVGAGVMAAQALARNLSERNEGGNPRATEGSGGQAQAPLSNVNTDMGGQDFGIADGGSWDDGGASDGGGGGDWDT